MWWGMIECVMHFHEIAGNLHTHTVYSDGTGLHRDVGEAAARAGLNFVVVTDHNVWVDGVEGYHDGTLLLVGEEIHDVTRTPQANHLLVYGAEAELAPYAQDPQRLVEEARSRGALCFPAHPFERGSPLGPELDPIPWVDWDVEGFAGLEIWNAMSEFKGLMRNRLVALFRALTPGPGLRSPFRATLRKWDELLAANRRLTAIGGADAHARTYHMGPLERVLYPYEDLFHWVNTHLLVERPMSGDLETDKTLIYGALRAGRTWVGYDRPAPTKGFRFHARSGARSATLGDELVRAGAINFEIKVPTRGDIRLLRDGRTAARARSTELRFTTAEPGVYRVEVYRTFRGLRRGWIFSSPIYVR